MPSKPIDLVKDFSEKRAVDGVSLAVPAGSIFGLLGPNGAGKTTTLRMLLGIIEPSSGERRVLGHSRPIEAAHQIGYLPEERGLYPSMNAREGIAFMGALRGLQLKEARRRADQLLEENGLGDWAKKPIRTLSKGMAQTVQLARHAGPRAAPDRPRRALFRPRPDQPGQARAPDPQPRGRRRDDHLLDPRDRPRRAPVRKHRDHRRRQGRLQRPRRRGARAAAPDRPPAHPRDRRAWRSALPGTARNEGGEWIFELPATGPSRCSRR